VTDTVIDLDNTEHVGNRQQDAVWHLPLIRDGSWKCDTWQVWITTLLRFRNVSNSRFPRTPYTFRCRGLQGFERRSAWKPQDAAGCRRPP